MSIDLSSSLAVTTVPIPTTVPDSTSRNSTTRKPKAFDAIVAPIVLKGHASMSDAVTARLTGMASLLDAQHGIDDNQKLKRKPPSVNCIRTSSSLANKASISLTFRASSKLIDSIVNLFPISKNIDSNESKSVSHTESVSLQKNLTSAIVSLEDLTSDQMNNTASNAINVFDFESHSLLVESEEGGHDAIIIDSGFPLTVPLVSITGDRNSQVKHSQNPFLPTLPLSVRLGALGQACFEAMQSADGSSTRTQSLFAFYTNSQNIDSSETTHQSSSSSTNSLGGKELALNDLLLTVFRSYERVAAIGIEDGLLLEAADAAELLMRESNDAKSSSTLISTIGKNLQSNKASTMNDCSGTDKSNYGYIFRNNTESNLDREQDLEMNSEDESSDDNLTRKQQDCHRKMTSKLSSRDKRDGNIGHSSIHYVDNEQSAQSEKVILNSDSGLNRSMGLGVGIPMAQKR
jgi:hypothetical protein